MPFRSGCPPSARGARYLAGCALTSKENKRIAAVVHLMVFMFRLRRGAPELPSVHRDIDLHLIELKLVASSRPCEQDMERHFDSAQVPIVGVVDLCGNAANGRIAIAHQAKEKARLLIEIQGGVNAMRTPPLYHVHQAVLPKSHDLRFFHGLAGRRRQIAYGRRHAHTQIRKGGFDLCGKGKLCVELSAIQLAAGYLVFVENGQRCAPPGFAPVEGPDAVAALRFFRKNDRSDVLIRELRGDLDVPSLSETTEADAGTG